MARAGMGNWEPGGHTATRFLASKAWQGASSALGHFMACAIVACPSKQTPQVRAKGKGSFFLSRPSPDVGIGAGFTVILHGPEAQPLSLFSKKTKAAAL